MFWFLEIHITYLQVELKWKILGLRIWGARFNKKNLNKWVSHSKEFLGLGTKFRKRNIIKMISFTTEFFGLRTRYGKEQVKKWISYAKEFLGQTSFLKIKF